MGTEGHRRNYGRLNILAEPRSHDVALAKHVHLLHEYAPSIHLNYVLHGKAAEDVIYVYCQPVHSRLIFDMVSHSVTG